MVHNKKLIASMLDKLAQLTDPCGKFSALAFYPADREKPEDLRAMIANPLFLIDSKAHDDLFDTALLDFRVHSIYPYSTFTLSALDAKPVPLQQVQKLNQDFKQRDFSCISFLTVEKKDVKHFANYIAEADAIIELYDNRYSNTQNFRYLLDKTHAESCNVICVDMLDSLCKSSWGGYASFSHLEYDVKGFTAESFDILGQIKDYLESKAIIDLYIILHVRSDLIGIIQKKLGLKALKAFDKYNVIVDFIYDADECDLESIDVLYSCKSL